MTRCTQPGCTGTIVDGYCDVCGSPGPVSTSPAAPSESRAQQPATTPDSSGARCTQPGCTGTIVDGYCDVCGSPAGPASESAAEDEAPIAPGGAVSAITRGSSRLQSTALGSQRVSDNGSKITKRVRSGSQRLRSARLGAGLTRVPPAPMIDAAKAIMKNPQVPEEKRNCPNCGAPVGRSRDGQPGRAEGFCPKCGTAFSFTPKLQPGDLVANQYEVAGCLAHGGLGWIYLAKDRNVSDRWVVLKGLLNTGDKDALAVAIVEKQFLAQVEHPLIVEIYNFVTHEDAGYIVMEYVGGTSLKQILKDRMRANNGKFDPLPVDQALAYILEVLPAFSYLHDLGLIYCDFKPDNLIQVGDAVKLIDLGGVRRVDDQESAIYGTIGYQAPEVAQVGPTVASDIYTIGRTCLVLMTEFRGYQTKYVASLPPVDETPVFAAHDSLYRLLSKACAADPADRFASVDEFQMTHASDWKHALNEYIFPDSTTFAWNNTHDLRDQKAKAEVAKLRAEERMTRINDGEISPAIARQIAVDAGDLDRELVQDVTTGGQLGDDEKPTDDEQPNPALAARFPMPTAPAAGPQGGQLSAAKDDDDADLAEARRLYEEVFGRA